MKKSVEKFERFMYSLDISQAKFAESIGLQRGALNIYLKRKRGTNKSSNPDDPEKEGELYTEYAISVSKVYKIDFYYFYDDSIPISADPIKEHPVVDNKRFSEWVENMASAMAEMSKKYEKSNSSNFKMMKEMANDVINEFISTTIKLESACKLSLDSNSYLVKIIEANDRLLINYAKTKSLDFINTINSIEKADAVSISSAMKKIYNFKLENASYIAMMDNVINVINKQKELIPYSEKFNDVSKEWEQILSRIENTQDDELINVWSEFSNAYFDFADIINYVSAFLLRDLINIEYKEIKDILIPQIRELFYDEGEFVDASNPKTHERLTKSFINLVEGKNPLKGIYEEVVINLNRLKTVLKEKGIGVDLC